MWSGKNWLVKRIQSVYSALNECITIESTCMQHHRHRHHWQHWQHNLSAFWMIWLSSHSLQAKVSNSVSCELFTFSLLLKTTFYVYIIQWTVRYINIKCSKTQLSLQVNVLVHVNWTSAWGEGGGGVSRYVSTLVMVPSQYAHPL